MIFEDSMPELNHAFNSSASILSRILLTIPAMTYGDRLAAAISDAGKSRADIAKAVGVSVQAVGQVIRGDSAAFTAENNAAAAIALEVNPNWLANGKGEMHAPTDQQAFSPMATDLAVMFDDITDPKKRRLAYARCVLALTGNSQYTPEQQATHAPAASTQTPHK